MRSALSASAPSKEDVLREYRTCWWMKSDHGAPLLRAEFESGETIELNFDVHLANNTSLADAANFALRSSIYDYLCVQSHPIIKGRRRRNRSPKTEKREFFTSVAAIDYFLMRDDQIRLSTHGFAGLGVQYLNQFLYEVSSAPAIIESIYCWSKRVEAHLRLSGARLALAEFEDVLDKHPAIEQINHSSNPGLELTDAEIVRARAYLVSTGLYKKLDVRSGFREFGMNGAAIAQLLYKDCLLGRSSRIPNRPIHPELCWGSLPSYARERRGVSVRIGFDDPGCAEQQYSAFRAKLLGWKPLSVLGVGMNEHTLLELEGLKHEFAAQLKPPGGTKPVPPWVVAECLREAIAYYFKHADHLLCSLANVLKAGAKARASPAKLAYSDTFSTLLDERSVADGITTWCLRMPVNERRIRKRGESYMEMLRGTEAGLLDRLQLLYGACAVILGSMQAARQGELGELHVNSLRATDAWLGLVSRKTGFDGRRYEHDVPAPAVAAAICRRLAELVRDIGRPSLPILAVPIENGRFSSSETYLYAAIDLFLDFIESPCTDDGMRYYLRPHQLRQFFASVFFQCCGFAGLDTLRWMLRHTDVRHLWAYIRTSVPGAVLQNFMSSAAVTLIRNSSDTTRSLTKLLHSRYGITDFDIVSDAELTEFLDELQRSKLVKMEPVFVGHGNETSLRLGILVWGE